MVPRNRRCGSYSSAGYASAAAGARGSTKWIPGNAVGMPVSCSPSQATENDSRQRNSEDIYDRPVWTRGGSIAHSLFAQMNQYWRNLWSHSCWGFSIFLLGGGGGRSILSLKRWVWTKSSVSLQLLFFFHPMNVRWTRKQNVPRTIKKQIYIYTVKKDR